MAKKILIISGIVGSGWLSGKPHGSQSFPQTIMGYSKRGWNVFLMVGFQARKKKKYFIEPSVNVFQFTNNKIRRFLLNANPHFFFRNIWWVYFQILSFFKGFFIARKVKPDVFYGYEIHAIPVAKLLSFIFKRPVIFRYQGTKVPSYKKQKFWKLRYFPHVLAMRLKANLYIMANDGTTGKTILEEMGIDSSKIRFWVNGVDKNMFDLSLNEDNTRDRLGFKKDDKIIISVSRLEKWKGIDKTINSLPAIIKKIPKIIYLIIGWGSEKENLEKIVKNLKLENHVRFIGMVQHDKLKDYYNICDIFVSMYDISNVGNPLFEAMAQGKCIVALDVGDTDKFIEDDKNGILIKKEKIKELSEKIIDLINNDEKRKMLSENVRKFAKKTLWDWDSRMDAEVKEVEKLIKN